MQLQAIRTLCEVPLPITVEIHEAALRIGQRYRYPIYDALILAAAMDAGCDVLYTEDMQHLQRIETLEIRNPFAS